LLSSAIIHRPLLYSSEIGALSRAYALEISILLSGVQDPSFEWITENNLLEGLHLKSFQKSFLSSTHALEVSIVLFSSHALEISILSFGVDDPFGCTEDAPNGCSPRALSGLLKIIYSKVFISCCFLGIILSSLPNALETNIISSTLCFRGQHIVLPLRSSMQSAHVLLGLKFI